MSDVGRESGPTKAFGAVPALFILGARLARRSRHCDLIYATGQKAFAASAVAARLARRPLVWHLHDILTAEHFSGSNRRLAVGLANWAATSVVANSHATATAFIGAGGKPGLVTVIHNGIPSAPFEAMGQANPSHTRNATGMPTDRPVIGVFSRLAPWKGQHVVLEALKGLPGTHALFVGDAEFGEDDYRESLKRLARERGVANRVRFLGFRRDIPELMAACDIVVHASTSAEPFGRVIVEGMLAGRPVIATRGGGTVEIIEDSKDGLLVEPGNSDALAAAVTSLIANPDLATRLATAGKRKAQTRFSLDAMLKSLEAHMSELLARRRT